MGILALGDERYTYLVFVPVISLLFIWMRRERFFEFRGIVRNWPALLFSPDFVWLSFLRGGFSGLVRANNFP